MPVTKHEKYIEPPGFEHISHLLADLPPAEQAELATPAEFESATVPDPVADPPVPKSARGNKSQED